MKKLNFTCQNSFSRKVLLRTFFLSSMLCLFAFQNLYATNTLNCTNKIITCNDPDLPAYRSTTPTENGEYICPPIITGDCPPEDYSLSLITFDLDYDPSCKIGTFVRRWIATRTVNGQTESITCDQLIRIDMLSDWTMNFPLDQVIECSAEGANLPSPLSINQILNNNGCDLWSMEVEDDIYDINGQNGDGPCYNVIRTYRFVNLCTWDPSTTELAIVNRPEGLLFNNNVQLRHRSINYGRNDFGDEDDSDVYDEITSSSDVTSPSSPDFNANIDAQDDGALVLLSNQFSQQTIPIYERTYNERINFNDHVLGCYAENYGFFAYRQIIKVVDTQAPIIDPIADLVICSTSSSDCGTDLTICGPTVTECRPTYFTTYTAISDEGNLIASGAFPQGATPSDCINLGFFACGVYTITYNISDGCGNFSEEVYSVTINDCPLSLATDWQNFTAQLNPQQQGILTWKVTSSVENDHFVIERSTNGRDFSTIGKVDSKKSNSSIESYQFIDDAVQSGLNYYRIQQVDASGKSSYSSIQEVYLNETVFNIQPNPTKDEIHLQFDLELEEKVEIEVFNTTGQLLYTRSFLVQSNGIDLSFGNMNIHQSGIYWIRAKTDQTSLKPISVVKID